MSDNVKTLFDDYADNYHDTLNQSLSVSGENTDYFAIERLKWLKHKLSQLFPDFVMKSILDYGCGTGDTLPILNAKFNPEKLIGIDLSVKNIELARKINKSTNTSFYTIENSPQNLNCELAYCNGVFHHIPLEERNTALKTVCDLLSDEGIFAFWENNPWNPGTKYIMKKCPFDKDAITLSFLESKKLLKLNGFKIVDVSFCFIFPKSLKFLRFLEKGLSSFPIGAQYMILARKMS